MDPRPGPHAGDAMTGRALCRDCLEPQEPAGRCRACNSPRLVDHPELPDLTIAHLDCDAFYAAVEKRDQPELNDRPVIVGGGRRGVVSAACYVARLYGVRSAMPMFKALKACPDAVVIKPDMAKYSRVGRQIRKMMEETTPLVEPISIDEAFLDLSGTEVLHGGSAARTCAALVRRIEHEVGVTASIGLSYNKFLAKLASDLDKPRGFAVIGRAEAERRLAPMPVNRIWGVGRKLLERLEKDGIHTIGDLHPYEEADLMRSYGVIGRRLFNFCRGLDHRLVTPDHAAKSISSETTFDTDITEGAALQARLWGLCEKVATRLKKADLAGRTVVLKLKTDRFRTLTRSRTLGEPTQLADVLFQCGVEMLQPLTDGTAYRLIGIGCSDLAPGERADPPDLLDQRRARQVQVERAIDAVRTKLGQTAIQRGRALALAADNRSDQGQTTSSGSRSRSTPRKTKSP